MLQATVRHTEYPQIMAASRNTAEDSSDVIQGGLPGGIGRTGASIPPETRSSNLRRLHAYRRFLESHEEWAVQTVDEHLRAVARMSAIFGHKPFETITVADVCRVKEAFRHLRDLEPSTGLSKPTVGHTLDRCRSFVRWLERRSDINLEPDLSGYFKLSRKERSAESAMVKGTSLNFDQALRIFAAMSGSSPAALRNRAIIALFISTGMRIGALISLRGKHVNVHTRWIDQDPREVDTKLGKHIRTYCLDLGSGLLEAIRQWARWRELNGFGDDAPFFLPDRYIQQNGLGLGYRPAQAETPQCWKSEDPAQRIIKDAAQAAGIAAEAIASHDFRRILHPFFARRGAMMIAEEVALQLNLGQTPTEIIRKHYAQMLDREREEILDELCRRALSHRTELELYLAFERNMLDVTHPDFTRAKDIFQRNARSEPAP